MIAIGNEPSADPSARKPLKLFQDLRKRNEYAGRVAEILAHQRERRIERIIQAQRALRARHRSR
jgi:hypothetical protein